jgi:toxin CcdB
MAQFDIYENSQRRAGDPVEYLLDLQAGVLEDLSTRVVAPLVSPEKVGSPMSLVNPRIVVRDEVLLLLTHLLAAIPVGALGQRVASAKAQRDEIVGAFDLLFTGA